MNEETVMKVFACERKGGKGLCVCAARSKQEAYGAAVMAEDTLKYSYTPDGFHELEGVTYNLGDTPVLLAEGGCE